MYPIINSIPFTPGKLSLKTRALFKQRNWLLFEEILVEMQLTGKGQHDTGSLSLKHLEHESNLISLK